MARVSRAGRVRVSLGGYVEGCGGGQDVGDLVEIPSVPHAQVSLVPQTSPPLASPSPAFQPLTYRRTVPGPGESGQRR